MSNGEIKDLTPTPPPQYQDRRLKNLHRKSEKEKLVKKKIQPLGN